MAGQCCARRAARARYARSAAHADARRQYAISTSAGSSERLFGELADTTVGGGAAVRVPLDEGEAQVRFVDPTQRARLPTAPLPLRSRRRHGVPVDPEDAYSPENAGVAMSMYEATLPTDGYAATRMTAAGYAMADANVTDDLRLIAGGRFEHSNLDVGLDSKIDLMAPSMPHTVHTQRRHPAVAQCGLRGHART